MKKAFTLIELLVVIAIIAILAAILFPVFARAKAAAKQSQNISNLKQLGTAAQIYVADYDDNMPSDSPQALPCPSGTGTTTRWANYYWPWLLQPYVKQQPQTLAKGTNSFYWNPNAPNSNPQDLSGSRARCIWPQPAQSWQLDCITPSGSSCTLLRYWTTYSINEHLGDYPGASSVTAWQSPAESFFLLEATDSEIEGDELDELYSRTLDCFSTYPDPANADATRGGHAGGTSIAYLDGHAKWRKTTWGAGGQCAVNGSGAPLFTFPPTTDGGDSVRVKGWTPVFDQ